MILFLTEMTEFVTAALMLAVAFPVFKKSNDYAICVHSRETK
jgi:hypothetical protein